MSSYGRYYRPALKQSVDVQLQTAFSDGNWSSVVRLADKRAKSTNDPYYEAVKVCAESQLESLTERCAAAVAVDALVRKGTTPKDVEALELYEWACRDAQPPLDYAETLGVLRSRWVKANPRSLAGISCLQACLGQWDLVNAQQIAAILDKSGNASDRRYMYWSIALTYLLSTSPQCPESKKKIYGMLAVKQLERASEIAVTKAEQAGDKAKSTAVSDRDMREEEEFVLYYKILMAQNARDDFVKKITNQHIGALNFFNEGKKHLMLEAITAFKSWERWDLIFEFCQKVLSATDLDGSPSFLASDWQIWKSFIAAAARQTDPDKAFEVVQDILQRFTSFRSKIAQMYVKNISRALVEIAFRMPPTLLSANTDPKQPSARVVQLCLFLEKHYDKSSVFDDLRSYVEEMSFVEAKSLLDQVLPKMLEAGSDPVRKTTLRLFSLKLRYFLTTCPQSLGQPTSSAAPSSDVHMLRYQCKTCESVVRKACSTCLRQLSVDTIAAYEAVDADSDLLKRIPEMDKDPRVDLALIAAFALLKLSGLFEEQEIVSTGPLINVEMTPLLQAVVLLDAQLQRNANDIPLRILLVQLYLLLGCGPYAYQLWTPLDVKRTIQDALSPLFFDRISSIAPGLFHGSRPLTEPLRSYYSSTLRDPAPVRIWDAFQSGSYSSILDMAEYNDRLRKSCTRVMAVVEERRAARAFGGRLEDLDDVPIFSEIDDATTLVNAIDYGSIPNLESSYAPSVARSLRLGPPLSNTRAHLSMLAEEYQEVISYKPPKDYKPAKPNDAALKDRAFILESLSSLHNSMTTFLHLAGTPSHLTSAELSYFTILSLLAGALVTALTADRTAPLPTTFNLLTSSIKSALSSLRAAFLSNLSSSPLTSTSTSTSTPPLPEARTFYALSDQHTMSTLRDAALALKHSAAFVLSHNEAQAQRDKSGRSNLHREILAEMRGLEALGAKTASEVRDGVKALKERLGEGGWLDRVEGWCGLNGDGDETANGLLRIVGGEAFVEEWIGRVLESWREGVKGWGMVRWE